MAATLKTTVIQEPSSGTVNMTLGSTGGVTFGSSITSNTITSAASTALTLQSAGTTAMTIDTSQNVGIGTSSPTSKLTMQTTGQNPLTLRTTTTALYDAATIYLNTSGSSANQGTVLYHGIQSGSDSSATSFQIQGYGNSYTYNSTWYIVDYKNNLQQWFTNGSERMRIDSSGNLLVGTTTSGGVGFSVIPQTSLGAPYLNLNKSYNGGITGFNFAYNGTSVGSITYTNSGTGFNTSSDYRLKENVTPMTTGLEKISALKPVTYDWINDKSAGEGFIAHELAEVVPLAVHGAKDAVGADGKPEYQGVDYSKIVVHLVAALQELSAKVDAQAAEITALKAKVGA